MKAIKVLIICLAAMLMLASCGFKNADSARNSMQNVNQSAEELKEESEAAKQSSEELKQREQNETVEQHKW